MEKKDFLAWLARANANNDQVMAGILETAKDLYFHDENDFLSVVKALSIAANIPPDDTLPLDDFKVSVMHKGLMKIGLAVLQSKIAEWEADHQTR